MTASATAALVIGFAARLVARWLTISALAVTTAAIVPLLPGRMAYEGISQLVTNPDGNGFAVGIPILVQAFGLGLGLAAGVSLGTYFAGLLVAKRQGVASRPAAGATLPTDPDPMATAAPRPCSPRRATACRPRRRPNRGATVSKHTAYDHWGVCRVLGQAGSRSSQRGG